MPRALDVRIRFGYACGSAVTGVFTTLPGLLLLPYLTDTLGVAAAAAGTAVLLPKAWDVLITPWAGRRGDRTRRSGGRRTHLTAGGTVTAIAFALIFAGVAHGTAGAVWAAVTFTLTATAFAFFHANYAALPGDLAPGPRERTALVAGRVAGIAVAALAAGAAAPALVTATGGGLAGYRWTGLSGALVIAAGTLAVRRITPARLPAPRRPDRHPRPWTVLRTTPGFAALVAGTALQVVATGCLLAGGPYFAEHALHHRELTSVLIAAFVLPNLLTTPWWTRHGARAGHRTALTHATLLFAGGCLLLAATPALPAAAPVCLFIAGTGHAGQLLFLYALLADHCADADRTGRPAGTLSGLFGAAESLGLAVGPFLFALALQSTGYASSATGHAAHQTGTARAGVVAGMTLLPALAALAGLALLHRRPTPLGGNEPATPAQARL